MSQVNLLPPEIRQKAKVRNQAILVAIAGAALVGFVIVLAVLQGVALRDVNSDLNAQVSYNASVTDQINDLQSFQDLATQLDTQQQIVDAAMAYEVSWSSALRDLQLVLPDYMSVATFTGSVTANTTTPPVIPTGGGPGIIGNIAVGGSSTGSLRLARWLSKLDEFKGWGNPWMASATRTVDSDVWVFSTTIDVFEDAATPRGQVPTP